ncbi:MAG: pyruvate kinase [Candidatus Lambdaproteobacteria bacterium]|nr:pyruvate kinase [Candidatus Lambdaproteobacteria bacterium]
MIDTRAKIVCTLGPSSRSPEVVRRMILAGMNVARLNFSHGTHEEHQAFIETVRRAATETGRHVGILLDLQGPRIRVGRFAAGEAELKAGAGFIVTARPVEGTAELVSTTYAGLPGDVKPGDTLLLDDGLISLRVERVEGPDIRCQVLIGGVLSNNKGINIPGAALSVASLSEKDLRDTDFGLAQGVDYLAMSFVRQAADVVQMKDYLARKGAQVPIVSKIEKPQAIENLDEILAVSDAIMVARGDMGVEMPTELVPVIQKRIIAACNRVGRPVITATQMLESMIHNPRPTRAEATDVANAILDGTDAVMLSGESASGRYPVEAVEVMRRIIHTAETERLPGPRLSERFFTGGTVPVHEGVAQSAAMLAERVDARAIVAITLTGSMARAVARHRPSRAIYAVSQNPQVLRQLCLVWGVDGIDMKDLTANIDDAVREVESLLVYRGRLAAGDRWVFTAGLPFASRQATNMVRVDVVR